MNVPAAPSLLCSIFALDSTSRHAAAALISGIWESLLLAVVVEACLAVAPKTTARLRFTIWAFAFIVLATLPVWNAFQGIDYPPVASNVPRFQLDPRWSYLLVALWLVTAIGRLGHFVVQVGRLRKVWKSAVRVSTALLPELHLGEVELCLSAEIDRPSVIGFLAPRILIPAWLFEQLSSCELEQIVLHELEHLRRRDDWINLLQKISLFLFPLNPALFWVDRRLAAERELACDDGVLSRTNAPRAYAACLTSLAERRLEHRRCHPFTALALGAVDAVRRSEFSRRIESILEFGFGRRSMTNSLHSKTFAILILAVVLGGAATLARARQLVSFNPATGGETDAAAMPTSMPLHTKSTIAARFESASFRPKAAVTDSAAQRPAKLRSKQTLHPKAHAMQIDPMSSYSVQRPDRSWMVFASFPQSESQPLLVTLPDGRNFLATYSTASTVYSNQAGWLLVQL